MVCDLAGDLSSDRAESEKGRGKGIFRIGSWCLFLLLLLFIYLFSAARLLAHAETVAEVALDREILCWL